MKFLIFISLFVTSQCNWLLQCSSCVDQSMYSDERLKTNIRSANLTELYKQFQSLRLRKFEHAEQEFFNKFFSRTQLGLIAQEVEAVTPTAVSLIPERRWTAVNGTQMRTKDVFMIREVHILFLLLGSTQHLSSAFEDLAAEYYPRIEKVDTAVTEAVGKLGIHEERITALLTRVSRTESSADSLDASHKNLDKRVADARNGLDSVRSEMLAKTDATQQHVGRLENQLNETAHELWATLEREAHSNLIERRKTAEANLEAAIVRRETEIARWQEEEKMQRVKAAEQKMVDSHSDELARRRLKDEMGRKEAHDKNMIALQEESNLRQQQDKLQREKEMLAMKLDVEREKLKVDLEAKVEQAKIDAEAKLRDKKENEEINLREMLARQSAEREAMLSAIREAASIAQEWIQSLYGSPENLALAIGSIIALFAGIYFSREAATLAREQLSKVLGKPSLVRRTSRKSIFSGIVERLKKRLFGDFRDKVFSDVVLPQDQYLQIKRLADATCTAKKRGAPLLHCMFYGPPGTGKTMVAERFAEYSGLEYAIMCGADVAPLKDQAVTELHKLFRWVKRSRRGVLLFIDEADSFMATRDGGGMSEEMRNALTTMLFHTGTPTSQFMLILATNRPGDLDSAVIDRIDESLEFGLPDLAERERLVTMYYDKYIASNSLKRGKKASRPTSPFIEPSPKGREVSHEALNDVALRCAGFSGREIAKMFMSLQTHMYALGQTFATEEILFSVCNYKIEEHRLCGDMVKHGYNYTGGRANKLLLPSDSEPVSSTICSARTT